MSLLRTTSGEPRTRGPLGERLGPGLVCRQLVALLVAGVIGWAGSASAADEGVARAVEEEHSDEGWTPALRVGFASVHVQGLDGSLVSPDSLEAIREPPTTPGVEDRSSPGAPGDSAVTQLIRLGIRVYAPEELLGERERFGSPRLFVQAEVDAPLDDGFIAARYDEDFDGSELTGVIGDFCPEVPPTESCAYSGRVKVDIKANWTLEVGADFELPFGEGQYHVVPTFGYFGQAYEAHGDFKVTLSQASVNDNVRKISTTSDTEFLHGVAAGLGLEIDVYESSLIRGKLFLNGRAAWLLNDRETRFSATNPIPTVNFNQANFMARPSGFVTAVSAGFEVRWTGRR